MIRCAVALFFVSVASGQGHLDRRILPESGHLVAVTADGFADGSGELVDVRGGPPWSAAPLATTGGGRHVRRFGRSYWVTDEASGRVTRFRGDGTLLLELHLGDQSMPQDVWRPDPTRAFVTRRDATGLLRVELASGVVHEAVDLSVLAGPSETIVQRTMEQDGARLFVQVGLLGSQGASRGVLAVVDLATETLLDVDPLAPGVQGIALDGAPPHLKMQVVPSTRTLFVSSTDGRLDNRGGIEMVDLDGLVSVGYAVTEAQAGGVDLGGFVLTSPAGGYLVFHTDIVPSTHLHAFTLAGGMEAPELLTLLGDAVEVLVHDRARGRLYLPSGFASFGALPGIHVFDASTGRPVGSPIQTGMKPHDLVLGG